MKLILLDKLRIGDIQGSNRFFSEYLILMIKKIYTDNSICQSIICKFNVILSHSKLLFSLDYSIKCAQVFDSFVNYFEKKLYYYIVKDNSFRIDNCYCELEDELVNMINIQISFINDHSSNYHNKKCYVPKPERNKDYIPILRNFSPTYVKKTIINKKILRKFKNFLKDKFISLTDGIDQKFDFIFWNRFIKENLLPPMKYSDNSNRDVEFKSFNIKYLIWFFNKEGALYLYNKFIEAAGKETLNEMIEDYNLESQNEIDQLQFYLYNLGEGFRDVNIQAKSYKDEAPLNPKSHEDMYQMYDNYLGKDFDVKMDDIFSYTKDDSNEIIRPTDRIREIDYILFDTLIKSPISSDKEE
jgi:hypothetical protein